MPDVRITHLSNIKGDTGAKGEKGDTGTIASVSVETIPPSDPPSVIMTGPQDARHAHFKVPAGAPGAAQEVTDAAIAGNLFSGATDSGVGFKRRVGYKVSILAHGAAADGVTSDVAAWMAARSEAGVEGAVYFPALPGGAETVYYFAGVTPNMKGTRIIADRGVRLKFQEPAGDVREWGLLTPVTIESVAHGWTRRVPATPDAAALDAFAWAAAPEPEEDAELVREDLTTWTAFSATTSSGVLTYGASEASSVTPNKVAWPASTSLPQQGVKKPVVLGRYYEATFGENGAYASKSYGVVFINGSAKYAWFRAAGNLGNVSVSQSATAGMLISPADGTVFTMPNGNAYKHLRIARYGFIMDTARRARVFINELHVATIVFNYDVVEVGWMSSATTWNKLVVRDAISSPNWAPPKVGPVTVSVVGDSQTYGAYGAMSWADLVPVAFAGLDGGGLIEVRQNIAVSGSSIAGWASGGTYDIAARDFAADDYVLVMLGTNDVQAGAGGDFGAGAGIDLVEENLSYIASQIVADGAIPVFGVFPTFTDPSVTGHGGTTSNYANTGEIRGVIQRFCAQNGYPLAMVNARFGANLGYWIDNAHPDHRGAALIARAFAQAIARHRRKLAS